MKTENLKNKNCLQKDSAERKEYAEVLSIFLPEDMEKECKLNAEHLMEETINPKNMEKAIRRVRQNNGAPGVDGKTVKETIEWINDHFTEVQAEMMGGKQSLKHWSHCTNHNSRITALVIVREEVDNRQS